MQRLSSDFLSNTTQVWNLHQTSKAYGQRPSQFIGIGDDWLALQFDLTVAEYGLYVEGKLEERDSKGKPKHTLKKILSGEKPSGLLTLMLQQGGEVIDL